MQPSSEFALGPGPSLRAKSSVLTFETALTHPRSPPSSIAIAIQTDGASPIDNINDDNKIPNPGPTRHLDLWFSDGSVVLRADNTLFRVHISQLSRHSAFFRDLFSLPQPSVRRQRSISSSSSFVDVDEGIQMEGCPVIVLHDSAEDVGNLLTALYDGPYVHSSSSPAPAPKHPLTETLVPTTNVTSHPHLASSASPPNTSLTPSAPKPLCI